jgi:hypothetical protein
MFTTKRTVRKHAKTSFPLGARLSRMGYVKEAVCFRAAANPGRDRSHVSSVAVRQMRKNPGVSNMAPGITRMSRSASSRAKASSSAIGERGKR